MLGCLLVSFVVVVVFQGAGVVPHPLKDPAMLLMLQREGEGVSANLRVKSKPEDIIIMKERDFNIG